jgi:hypothetical protein
MKTSPKQISLFGEGESMFLQEDSHASPSLFQEREKAQKMTDISGRKCLEQYEKLSQATSLGKTFMELLAGMTDWYSNRCKVTWRLKGTKYNRLFFQLQVSTLPTEGIEYGLLRTPTTMDISEGAMKEAAKLMNGKTKRSSGQNVQITLNQQMMMEYLKDKPKLVESLNQEKQILRVDPPSQEEFLDWIRSINKSVFVEMGIKKTTVDHWYRKDEAGFSLPKMEDWLIIINQMEVPMLLREKMERIKEKDWTGLLPTPAARDWKDTGNIDALAKLHDKRASPSIALICAKNIKLGLLPTPNASDNIDRGSMNNKYNQRRAEIGKQIGLTVIMKTIGENMNDPTLIPSQLNPLFVAEMMGFPIAWTLSPFQSGEKNQSKPTETQ